MHQSTAIQQFHLPPGLVDHQQARGISLRVVERPDGPWFVARDVCAVLGLADAYSSLRTLDEDERGEHTMPSPSGQQKYNIVNESGFYSLVLRSRRPEARAFRRWVTGEVLPAIRKTGRYLPERELTRRELITLALQAEDRADAAEAETLKLGQAAIELGDTVRELRPKGEAFDTYLDAKGLKPIAVVAQQLGTGQNRLFAFLRKHRVLIGIAGARWNTPYQDRVDEGWFEVKAETWQYKPGTADEETRTTWTTLVTPKGEAGIERLIRRHGKP
jgi:prophage antirepressor-like protein